MRRLMAIIIYAVLASVNSLFAQEDDSLRNHKNWCFFNGIIMIDGIKYSGDSVDPKTIRAVAYFNEANAQKILGVSSKNGVTLIRTNTYYIDSLKTALNIRHLNGDSVLIVIDGNVSNKSLNQIDPNDIISLKYLERDKNIGFIHNVIVLNTKAIAIKSYQEKFSLFSLEYKAYIEKHRNDDSGLRYFSSRIRNEYTPQFTSEAIEQLWLIPKDKILKVGFFSIPKDVYAEDGRPLVVIKTKKY